LSPFLTLSFWFWEGFSFSAQILLFLEGSVSGTGSYLDQYATLNRSCDFSILVVRMQGWLLSIDSWEYLCGYCELKRHLFALDTASRALNLANVIGKKTGISTVV